MFEFLSRAKYLLLSALFLLATYNITKTTLEIHESSKRLEELRSEFGQQKAENAKLMGDFEHSKTEGFVEEIARNKLNMARPGERVLIPVVAGASTEGKSLSDEIREGLLGQEGLPNYKKWLKLFL
jgi:cell division protein FtsB